MFNNIVAAITPSPACEPAADKAMAFAQLFESHLSFIYAICHLEEGWGSLDCGVSLFEDMDNVKQAFYEHYREKLRGVDSYEINIVPGVPHTEILRLAYRKEANLIVMGPHTKDIDISHVKMREFAGSCLERVSQKARCPVMIVSYSEPYGEQRFKNILVATDFSSAARCAVSYACQLAEQYGAALHLAHIMDLDLNYPWNLPSQRETCKYLDASKQSMESKYATFLKNLTHYSIEAWEGIPAIEILKLSRMKEADLIIMAHHSKEKDPERAFLGSTVVQVAMHSSCPTVSVNKSQCINYKI